MCFFLAIRTVLETPPQAGLETGESRILQCYLSPVQHDILDTRQVVRSQNHQLNFMTWDVAIFCGDVGESKHLDILDDVLLGDGLSCTVLGVQ
jgi:hypothetical protein